LEGRAAWRRHLSNGAISHEDANGRRIARLDLAKCIFCGLCAEIDPAIA